MLQKWPVRKGRPYQTKFVPVTPLQSGQRVLTPCFQWPREEPLRFQGPFGSGKTVVQHAWPNGLMWMWWSILAAESAAMR